VNAWEIGLADLTNGLAIEIPADAKGLDILAIFTAVAPTDTSITAALLPA
jgi:hypothetical protein